MIKRIAIESMFGLTVLLAPPTAQSADGCLGVSIGPGCLGLGSQRDHVYRRVETRPANPHVYEAPDGGRYYYDDSTYFYEERD